MSFARVIPGLGVPLIPGESCLALYRSLRPWEKSACAKCRWSSSWSRAQRHVILQTWTASAVLPLTWRAPSSQCRSPFMALRSVRRSSQPGETETATGGAVSFNFFGSFELFNPSYQQKPSKRPLYERFCHYVQSTSHNSGFRQQEPWSWMPAIAFYPTCHMRIWSAVFCTPTRSPLQLDGKRGWYRDIPNRQMKERLEA